MRGKLFIEAVAIVLLGVGAFEIRRVSQHPPQQPHRTVARVEAVKAMDSKVRFSGDWVYVRNEHAFGVFSMLDADVHCEVGDEVPVLQQGASLSRLPETCRGRV
jgi:hypothetical protein